MNSFLQRMPFAFILLLITLGSVHSQNCSNVTPTVASKTLTYPSITSNATTLQWTKGNGHKRIVIAKEASGVTSSPVRGTEYTANAVFGQGSQLKTGEFVVYSDTGNSVHITGLKAATLYYFKIVEFDGCTSTLYQGASLIGYKKTMKAPQAITFSSISNKTLNSAPFSLTATSNSGLPITFSITAGADLASISGNTVTLSGISGSVTIQASQAGNDTYLAASVSKSFNIIKNNQTVTLAEIPTKYVNSVPFTVYGTASSGLPVNYVIMKGPATASGNTITLTGVSGTVYIRCVQSGNAQYNSALFDYTLLVNKLTQTISFTTIPNKTTTASPFSVHATSNSGLPITYSIVSGPATIAENVITLTGQPGTVTVKAFQAGNGNYIARSMNKTFEVTSSAAREGNADANTASQALSIYPNPSSGLVHLNFKQAERITSIKIMDTKGNVIKQEEVSLLTDSYSIDLSGTPKGMYLIQVISDSGVTTENVVID